MRVVSGSGSGQDAGAAVVPVPQVTPGGSGPGPWQGSLTQGIPEISHVYCQMPSWHAVYEQGALIPPNIPPPGQTTACVKSAGLWLGSQADDDPDRLVF